MMKILITGISGFLGTNLAREMAANHDIYGICRAMTHYVRVYNTEPMDITEADGLREYVKRISPDVIIHGAAMTNVDQCEEEPEAAGRINVQGTMNIADAAKEVRARIIYISTDQVFDGTKGAYTEYDEASPVNIYGKTKLEAEKVLKERLEEHLIIRTNFFGWSPQEKCSFAEWILNAAFENERIILFNDFIFTPLLVNNLCMVIKELLQKQLCGTLHLGSSDACTKFEFGRMLLEEFGMDITKTEIKQGGISDVTLSAKRPQNVSLNCDKARGILVSKLLPVKSGLRLFRGLADRGYSLIKNKFIRRF